MLNLSCICTLTILLLFGEGTMTLKRRNPCQQQELTCSCAFPDGQRLDLSPLSLRMFLLEDHERNYTFIFNPCREHGVSGCPNTTSICYLDNYHQNFTILGMFAETSFSSDASSISLIYNHSPMYTEIHLQCSDDKESSFSFCSNDKKNNIDFYSFLLRSPDACLKSVSNDSYIHADGLSTGSILVILFLVFGSVYFLGGSAANYLLQGARGWEMIPNRDFWLDLPKLCEDGLKFAVNGCSVTPSYEQI